MSTALAEQEVVDMKETQGEPEAVVAESNGNPPVDAPAADAPDYVRQHYEAICEVCSDELGGGIHSAAIVRQERMAMKKDGRR
jgi:hypothetical protein